jgi:dGTPase
MAMVNYHKLLPEIERQIVNDRNNHISNPYRALDGNAVRRNMERDKNTVLRPSYARDIDKILHLPLYNRYNDKTQVFSFYHNDDIARRGLHVQLVSRIARNIGRLLGLNLDLIEAIAIGHDIGHTPFGHAGEKFLSKLLQKETGRYFNHNVHSTRVLDILYKRNVSLQVLDGVLCHNGEFEMNEYRPCTLEDFTEYDNRVEACYKSGGDAIKTLVPMTLEGCVVRICDIIAYVGKDRQDAVTAKIIDESFKFDDLSAIGNTNAEIINNLVVDIVNNSYGKDYLKLSDDTYKAISKAKKDNYAHIYLNSDVSERFGQVIEPMFQDIYYSLLYDVTHKKEDSVVYKHHIAYIKEGLKYYEDYDYLREEPNQIVTDFIASMTDDYFVELHKYLFPDSKLSIEYKSYFEE